MLADIAYLFVGSLLISLATFGGGAQAMFYQLGSVQHTWVTQTDLSAGLAFGYATPGPAVFGLATFIGYRVGGVAGAVVGTLGVYIAPFLIALIAARFLARLMHSPHAVAFVQGIGLAAAGIVLATAVHLLDGAGASVWQLGVAVLGAAACLRGHVNPLYVLLVGGGVGLVL